MLSSICGMFLASTIALDGVSGSSLRAVASFDSNNVHVGDPMVLTVDFIGNADFASLHPPALSREVDRSQWRVDDTSAKTETYSNARRLVYRIRPLKDGVLTISGTGKMDDFRYDSEDAWRECTMLIRSVEIWNGVTSIIVGASSVKQLETNLRCV